MVTMSKTRKNMNTESKEFLDRKWKKDVLLVRLNFYDWCSGKPIERFMLCIKFKCCLRVCCRSEEMILVAVQPSDVKNCWIHFPEGKEGLH